MSQQIINYQHVANKLIDIGSRVAKCNSLILEGILTRSIGFTLEGKGF
jgi:hypothetical protein